MKDKTFLSAQKRMPKVMGRALWLGRRLWRLIRWVFEFGIPLYTLVIVVTLTLMIAIIGGKVVKVPGLGAISITSTTAQSDLKNSSAELKTEQVHGGNERAATIKLSQSVANQKVEIEVLKEKISSLKEAQQQTLVIIGGLAALLTFLGFRGYSTIAEAHASVQEAESRAEDVKIELDNMKVDLDDFTEEKYEADTKASLNVMHGIVAREVANSIEKQIRAANKDPLQDEDFIRCIDQGLFYVGQVTEKKGAVNDSIVKRAYGVKGNLLKRKACYEEAMHQSRAILNKLDPEDAYAWYNLACYASMRAAELSGNPNAATEIDRFADEGIEAIGKACALRRPFANDAKKDADLSWLASNRKVDFDLAIK